jgi:hypothetical protein
MAGEIAAREPADRVGLGIGVGDVVLVGGDLGGLVFPWL